ncbi:hypothetical protein CCY01nite_35570 [Chitinophaga cymbidii]|uniref:Streptomycin biosynthesis protein StrF domain-containing protein n=1 Tax=Chitinophaga cymbidii TaxID=1096750 RepID=A0A512RNN0_9BACT|nr:hypothetical protein CCY01nite_35570 [Chitinophaga cymbidii]
MKESIADTIGLSYELIAVDNTDGRMGLCEAYNTAAKKASFDVLCFMHDDVQFLTKDWGKRVVAHFSADDALAAIGLAGSRYKSRTLSGWWSGLADCDCCNIRQQKPDGEIEHVYVRPPLLSGDVIPVRVLDGVWICMRKEVWQEFPFAEEQLRRFHFYDVDVSLRISAKRKVAVVYDVDLVHFSYGAFGNDWIREAIRFHRSVNQVKLPGAIGTPHERNPERAVMRAWLLRLRREKISLRNKLAWCKTAGVWQNPGNWPYIFLFLTSISFARFRKKA